MNIHIKSEKTDKHLSSLGGLTLFAKFWSTLKMPAMISNFLPQVRHSLKKFEDLSLGFAAGAECLDDISTLALDEGFRAVCDEKVYTAKSYGDYLREFTEPQIDEGNRALARSAFMQRAKIDKKMTSMTFDFDSTFNEQYAEKMEGVCFSGEKKATGLTTMYVFDELGFQYYGDVRPGNTHTSHSIAKIIHMVLSQMPTEGTYKAEEVYLPWLKSPYKKKIHLYARADAGYSNSEFMNGCFAKNMGFVVRLKEDMLTPKLKNITNWKDTKKRLKPIKRRDGRTDYVDKSIRFYDGRRAEIGSTIYRNENMVHATRLICIRAKKPGSLGLKAEDYDYYAWLTNIGEHEMNNEKIIFFYRARGQAENYIKSLKYGYDMHHYPCLKLDANRAYCLIAGFSYNVLRFIALQDNPSKPHYAKVLRNKLINLPCQVVRRSGQVFFKFMETHLMEVERFLIKLKNLQYGYT
ncbi:MAG: IS1380 family transposase [Oligoflexales bacterium]|nr:IS1380 family transposase [Oligoflexales bacterium]